MSGRGSDSPTCVYCAGSLQRRLRVHLDSRSSGRHRRARRRPACGRRPRGLRPSSSVQVVGRRAKPLGRHARAAPSRAVAAAWRSSTPPRITPVLPAVGPWFGRERAVAFDEVDARHAAARAPRRPSAASRCGGRCRDRPCPNRRSPSRRARNARNESTCDVGKAAARSALRLRVTPAAKPREREADDQGAAPSSSRRVSAAAEIAMRLSMVMHSWRGRARARPQHPVVRAATAQVAGQRRCACSRVGFGLRASSATALITMPFVQ